MRDGAIFTSGFMLELIATPAPTRVLREEQPLPRLASPALLDEVAQGWAWTPERRGTLLVKLPPGDARVRVF